ncbi:hypothetical protein BDQ17DRAFT_1423063 [Cyathus striatus]|nr:hypothetical protein BDQ17DRAFT_1423063 [Cyathus striatus]
MSNSEHSIYACVLVRSDLEIAKEPFLIVSAQNVFNLKDKIRERFPSFPNDVGDVLYIWRCLDPVLPASADERRLQDLINTINLDDETQATLLGGATVLKDLGISDNELLLAQLSERKTRKRKRQSGNPSYNVHDDLKRSKLVASAPSAIATASQYYDLQNIPSQRILDDFPSPDNDPAPIELLYSGFERKALKLQVDQFCVAINKPYDNEMEKNDVLIKHLQDIIRTWIPGNIPMPHRGAIGQFHTNGHFLGVHGGPEFVLELKYSIFHINAKPSAQMTAYTGQLHSMLNEAGVIMFKAWRMPCLGITLIDDTLTFFGVINIGSQYRVEHLAPSLSCSPNGEMRTLLYKAFTAALVTLSRIHEDGVDIHSNVSDLVAIPKGLHHYPAITGVQRFTSGKVSKNSLKFKINEFYPSREINRWLYLAETMDETPSKTIVIKFTKRYCTDLHYFNWTRGSAPELLGYQQLPGNWHCIAMDYISNAKSLISENVLHSGNVNTLKDKIRELVLSFHKAGWVHGDLRLPNFLYDGEKIFLVDYDWAGKEGHEYDEEVWYYLNSQLLEGRTRQDRAITKSDDIRVMSSSFKMMELLVE